MRSRQASRLARDTDVDQKLVADKDMKESGSEAASPAKGEEPSARLLPLPLSAKGGAFLMHAPAGESQQTSTVDSGCRSHSHESGSSGSGEAPSRPLMLGDTQPAAADSSVLGVRTPGPRSVGSFRRGGLLLAVAASSAPSGGTDGLLDVSERPQPLEGTPAGSRPATPAGERPAGEGSRRIRVSSSTAAADGRLASPSAPRFRSLSFSAASAGSPEAAPRPPRVAQSFFRDARVAPLLELPGESPEGNFAGEAESDLRRAWANWTVDRAGSNAAGASLSGGAWADVVVDIRKDGFEGAADGSDRPPAALTAWGSRPRRTAFGPGPRPSDASVAESEARGHNSERLATAGSGGPLITAAAALSTVSRPRSGWLRTDGMSTSGSDTDDSAGWPLATEAPANAPAGSCGQTAADEEDTLVFTQWELESTTSVASAQETAEEAARVCPRAAPYAAPPRPEAVVWTDAPSWGEETRGPTPMAQAGRPGPGARRRMFDWLPLPGLAGPAGEGDVSARDVAITFADARSGAAHGQRPPKTPPLGLVRAYRLGLERDEGGETRAEGAAGQAAGQHDEGAARAAALLTVRQNPFFSEEEVS